MRGTRQGRTIELRLKGRLLCLWGLLGRAGSLGTGELSLLPLTHLGTSTLRPLGCGLHATCLSLPCASGADGQLAWHHEAARTCDKGMDEMRAL